MHMNSPKQTQIYLYCSIICLGALITISDRKTNNSNNGVSVVVTKNTLDVLNVLQNDFDIYVDSVDKLLELQTTNERLNYLEEKKTKNSIDIVLFTPKSLSKIDPTMVGYYLKLPTLVNLASSVLLLPDQFAKINIPRSQIDLFVRESDVVSEHKNKYESIYKETLSKLVKNINRKPCVMTIV